MGLTLMVWLASRPKGESKQALQPARDPGQMRSWETSSSRWTYQKKWARAIQSRMIWLKTGLKWRQEVLSRRSPPRPVLFHHKQETQLLRLVSRRLRGTTHLRPIMTSLVGSRRKFRLKRLPYPWINFINWPPPQQWKKKILTNLRTGITLMTTQLPVKVSVRADT